MTDDRSLDHELDALAGEYAIGVAEDADRARAELLIRSNPVFRAAVARWSGRLAPLLDEVEGVAPPRALWPGIAARLGGASDNIVSLTRRLSIWRGAAVASGALAACLAIVLAVQPRTIAPAPVAQSSPTAPLVAMVGGGEQTKVVASWEPGRRQLVLAVAADMPPDPTHAHELWVIPSGGKPRSLGTMPAVKRMHMNLEQALAALMRDGATIAISVEPRGGSPTGAPTGPMVASGTLQTA